MEVLVSGELHELLQQPADNLIRLLIGRIQAHAINRTNVRLDGVRAGNGGVGIRQSPAVRVPGNVKLQHHTHAPQASIFNDRAHISMRVDISLAPGAGLGQAWEGFGSKGEGVRVFDVPVEHVEAVVGHLSHNVQHRGYREKVVRGVEEQPLYLSKENKYGKR